MPVLSCLTVQDTRNVYGAEAVNPELIRQQLRCISEDAPIHAIKTGALGNSAVVEVLVEFLGKYPDIPVITDPVIKAAGGGDLADDELLATMKERLFPLAEMITPNGIELALLGKVITRTRLRANCSRKAAHRCLQLAGMARVYASPIHFITIRLRP